MSSELGIGCRIIAGTRPCDSLSCESQSPLTSQKRIRVPKSRVLVQCIIPTVYTEGVLPPISTFVIGSSATIIHNMPPPDRMSRRVGVDLATDEVRG
jgi:hypothetical protein